MAALTLDTLEIAEEPAPSTPYAEAPAPAPTGSPAPAPALVDEPAPWSDSPTSPIEAPPPPPPALSPTSSYYSAASPTRSVFSSHTRDAFDDDDDDAFDDGRSDVSDASASSDDDACDDPEDVGKVPGTYRDVRLHAARLGLTLENVLEATVVHEVDRDGAAQEAGLVADVLVVGVNGETTRGLLHEEVITLLRTPERPLTLKVQDLDPPTLARRRKEARGLALAARQPAASRLDASIDKAPMLEAVIRALRRAGCLPSSMPLQSPPPPGQPRPDAMLELALCLAGLDDLCSRPTAGGRRARSALCRHEAALAPALAKVIEGGAHNGPMDAPRRPMALLLPPADDDAELAAGAASYAAQASAGDAFAPCRWASAAALPLHAGSPAAASALSAARLLCRIAALQRGRSHAAGRTIKHLARLAALACGDAPASALVAQRSARACAALAPTLRACARPRYDAFARACVAKGARDTADAQARAAFVRSAGGFCGGLTTRPVAKFLARQCAKFARDALPCVRRAALDACLSLSAGLPQTLEDDGEDQTFSRDEFLHLLLASLIPIALQLATDASSEVRAAFALRAGALCHAFGAQRAPVLADEARALLEDDDMSVRAAACEAIPRIAELAEGCKSETLCAALTPSAARLASDESHECRAALAKTSGALLQALGNDPEAALKAHDADESVASLDRALFPLLLILVNDEAPVVACTALRGLAECGAGLARVLAPRHVDAVTNSLMNLATSRHWRVRCCACRVAPSLAPACDTEDRRIALAHVVAKGLDDVVHEVRTNACQCACACAAAASRRNDAFWVQMPLAEVARFGAAPSSKQRRTGLVLARSLVDASSSFAPADRARCREDAAALGAALAADPLPLVRMDAALLLAAPLPCADGLVETLAGDDDPDVAEAGFAALRARERQGDDDDSCAVDHGSQSVLSDLVDPADVDVVADAVADDSPAPS